jgi:two-component system, chemotaxis family, chemotaxis protein CheY
MALNVLVVDDSAVMRSMIIRVLKLSGVPLGDIHQAANGAEALKLLDQHWVDLALVDINMPVMNGEEMINRVRANPETAALPIVVVSTESSEARIELLQKLGTQFVHKPFTAEDLRSKITQLTGISDDQGFGAGPEQGDSTSF